MSSSSSVGSKTGTVFRTVILALVVGVVVAVAWNFASTIAYFAGLRLIDISGPWFGASHIVAFLIAVAVVAVRARSRHSKRVRQEAAQAAAEVERRAAEEREVTRHLQGQALLSMSHAVNAFERMPASLTTAGRSYSRARETYSDGAFSPFWSAIEASYVALAAYVSDANRIAHCAHQHGQAIRTLADRGALNPELATFPVTLDVRRVEQHHKEFVGNLDRLVYEAQRQPTFATIWEQRRTTAAVIEGFANLEQATAQMNSALSASISNLTGWVAETQRTVARYGAGTQTAIVTASAEQQDVARELTRRASEIRDELYYPGLRRWLG